MKTGRQFFFCVNREVKNWYLLYVHCAQMVIERWQLDRWWLGVNVLQHHVHSCTRPLIIRWPRANLNCFQLWNCWKADNWLLPQELFIFKHNSMNYVHTKKLRPSLNVLVDFERSSFSIALAPGSQMATRDLLSCPVSSVLRDAENT